MEPSPPNAWLWMEMSKVRFTAVMSLLSRKHMSSATFTTNLLPLRGVPSSMAVQCEKAAKRPRNSQQNHQRKIHERASLAGLIGPLVNIDVQRSPHFACDERKQPIPKARAAQALGVGDVEAQICGASSDRGLLLGLEFPEPSLNVREQMRLVAVWAGQCSYPSRQGSEGLSIQIDACINLTARCWAVEFQRCHQYGDSKSPMFCRIGIATL
jgi:hypothetical protein